MNVGVESNLAIYDAVYVALAEHLDCPLITVDAKQADVALAVGITFKSLLDFPEFKESEER